MGRPQKRKIEIEEGIRIPGLRTRTDGRFSVRFQRDGKRHEKYFDPDEGDIQLQYRNWRRAYVLTRQSVQVPERRPTPQPRLGEDAEFNQLLSQFLAEVEHRSEQSQRRNRERGRFGRFDKNYYAAKNLVTALKPLIVQADLRLADVGRSFAPLVMATIRSTPAGERPHSRQWADSVLGMARRFAKWCQETHGLNASGMQALAAAIATEPDFRRLPTSTRRSARGIPKSAELLKIDTAEADPLLGLLVRLQLLNVARPAEVLALQRAYLVEGGGVAQNDLHFAVPHKTDWRKHTEPRHLVISGEAATQVQRLLQVAGDAPIFSPAMRYCLRDGWQSLDVLEARYRRTKREKSKPITACNYRKLFQKHFPAHAPYDVRRRAISDLLNFGHAEAAAAANHADLRTVLRYMDSSPEAKKRILRTAAQRLQSGIDADAA